MERHLLRGKTGRKWWGNTLSDNKRTGGVIGEGGLDMYPIIYYSYVTAML